MHFRHSIVFVAVIAAALAIVVTDATPVLRMVHLMHRHGARTPIVLENTERFCGINPCGELVEEGRAMLMSLGATLQQRYSGFLPAQYDPLTILSRSTYIDRTLQSAMGMLWGLFPNASNFFPVVRSRPLDEDTLLVPNNAWPAWLVHTHTPSFLSAVSAAISAEAANLGITSAVMTQIGIETSQPSLCPDYPMYCLLVAWDVAAYVNAIGTLPTYPTLRTYYNQMRRLQEVYNLAQYAYNASREYDIGMGSQGYIMAKSIIAGFNSSAGGALRERLVHWSAHDTSLMPLYITMGLRTIPPATTSAWEGFVPDFAETALFEAYEDDVTGAVTVRAQVGTPEQTPGAHPYTFRPLPMTCIDATGASYTVTSGAGCPLEDWNRFIETTAPRAPGGGVCYFDPADQEELCGDASAAPQDDNCVMFRRVCPETACAATTVPSLVDPASGYTCVASAPAAPLTNAPTPAAPVEAGVARSVVIGVGAGLGVGCLLFLVIGYVIGSRKPDRKSVV